MNYRPLRPPQSDFDLRLYTFQDAIDHVLLAFDVDGHGSHSRMARAAITEAYRRFPDESAWKFYERRARIATEAAISSGSISYDADTQTVTLSDATWPADARFWWLILDRSLAKVESRVSDTEITLNPYQSPAKNISAGASYVLFKSIYPLPPDYRKGGKVMSLDNACNPTPMPIDRLLEIQINNYDPQDFPNYYAIRQSEDYLGGICIEFAPPPLTVRTFDFYYTASPRPLTFFSNSAEYVQGSATTQLESATVTFDDDAVLSNSMVGCVLRISAGGTVPTGMIGSFSSDNPYDEQRVIQSIDGDANTAVVDQPFLEAYANAKFAIGAPLDLEPESMLTAFLLLCEATFSRMGRQKERNEYYARYIEEVKVAMAADQRSLNQQPLTWVYLDNLDQLDRR